MDSLDENNTPKQVKDEPEAMVTDEEEVNPPDLKDDLNNLKEMLEELQNELIKNVGDSVLNPQEQVSCEQMELEVKIEEGTKESAESTELIESKELVESTYELSSNTVKDDVEDVLKETELMLQELKELFETLWKC